MNLSACAPFFVRTDSAIVAPSPKGSLMISVFSELKRRHVYRTAAFYAAAAWLLVQVATQVAPYFDMPTWSVRLVIVACVAGFPVDHRQVVLVAVVFRIFGEQPIQLLAPRVESRRTLIGL